MKYKYVYHVLDVDALLFTLKSNILQGKNYSGVSTSYDPKFNSYIGDRPWSFFKLQLDAQLLIQDGYNLKRFDYVSNNNQKFDEKEYQQRLKIQNIKKYITKIILIFSKFNSLKDAVFSQIGHQPNKFKEDIKWLYQNYKKDLYLQKLNHTFVKSDSFFQKIINKKIEIEYFGFEIYKKIEKYVKGNKDRMSHFEYEYIPFNKKIGFSRLAVLTRDNFKCQYCGIELPAKELTIDHVIPKSKWYKLGYKGSSSVFTNVVACCIKCNKYKANHLLTEKGMKLLKEPKNISRTENFINKLQSGKIPKEWEPFLLESSTYEQQKTSSSNKTK